MAQFGKYEGFYWVAKCGGYSKAVRAFPYPITQPGVHAQVKRLESELGVKLLERIGRDTMVMTSAGQMLYEFIAPYYRGLPNVLERLRAYNYGGLLRVQSSRLLIRDIVSPWMSRLKKSHGEIRLVFDEIRWADIDRLRNLEADLIVEFFDEFPEDIVFRPIAGIRAHMVAPRGDTEVNNAYMCERLHALPFIAYNEDSPDWALQQKALRAYKIEPQDIIRADNSETIVGLVGASLGASIVPAVDGVGVDNRDVVGLPINVDEAFFPVHVAWRRTEFPNPIIERALAFIDDPPGGI